MDVYMLQGTRNKALMYFSGFDLEPTTVVSNGNNSLIPKFNSFLIIDGNQLIYENIN
jgi:hypothetical protein